MPKARVAVLQVIAKELGVTAAAAKYGYPPDSISVATLYDWRVDGVGPQAVKLGRALRYPESCVRTWIEEKLRG